MLDYRYSKILVRGFRGKEHQMTTAGRPDRQTIYIGGSWREAADHFERRNPANLAAAAGTYGSATPADVDGAYDAASDAQPGWSGASVHERADVLRRAADILEARAEQATATLVADIGKAHRDARGEVLRGAAILRFHAGAALQASGETFGATDPQTLLLTLREPLGVVAAVTPWNFPVAIPLWKLAPALAYGNAVVWKPAEAASGSAVLLAQVFEDAGLPPGVLNLLTGSGRALSASITSHPALAGLTFTGSVGVGQTLERALAGRNVKLQLELGGKNPAIVLADADIDDAVEQVARGAMLQAGQRCTATSRVYVEQAVRDEFVSKLVARVERFEVGDPSSPATDIGPVASREQFDAIRGYLQGAVADGITALCGGTAGAGDEGLWIMPTVYVDVPEDHPLIREEVFGPVLCVNAVDDVDDAIRLANDSEFGLSSGIFTRDLGTALRFARETQSGLVHVNRETAGVEVNAPFGGVKSSSSMHREQGLAAREFFTFEKTVYVRPR